MTRPILALTFLLASAVATPAFAQSGGPEDTTVRAAALDTLSRRLSHYVDPAVIPGLRAILAERRSAYLRIPDTGRFIASVNADLLTVSRDRHLQILVEAQSRDAPTVEAPPSPTVNDHGIRRVIRGPDAAVLELSYISGDPEAAIALDAALDSVRGAPALILDLRDNTGGGEAVQRRLLGHLAPRPPVLEELWFRRCLPDPVDAEGCLPGGGVRVERRIADAVPNPAFADQPVFVLTSDRTFSAAEAIAYNLQAMGRAVIVGEVTGGGANPSAGMDLGPWFTVIMPIATSRLPLTSANWEGAGVQPDVPVNEARAMEVALGLARQGR